MPAALTAASSALYFADRVAKSFLIAVIAALVDVSDAAVASVVAAVAAGTAATVLPPDVPPDESVNATIAVWSNTPPRSVAVGTLLPAIAVVAVVPMIGAKVDGLPVTEPHAIGVLVAVYCASNADLLM